MILVEFARWDHGTIAASGRDGIWTREEMSTGRGDMFRAQEGSFLNVIATGQPVECGIAEARKPVEIVDLALADAGIPVA